MKFLTEQNSDLRDDLKRTTSNLREAATEIVKLEDGIGKHREEYYISRAISHRDYIDKELYKLIEK